MPKEKPLHVQLLNEARSLISDGDVLKAYDLVCKCANEKSPRGNFFKACMLYLAETESGANKDEVLASLSIAEKAKYPFAELVKVDYLFSLGDTDALYKVVRSVKGSVPSALYYDGGFYAGYVETTLKCKRNLSKACVCFEKSAETYLEYHNEIAKDSDWLLDMLACIGNDRYFAEQAGYAYQMLMTAYADIDDKANKQKYVTAYSNSQRYGNAVVRYQTAAAYASDCMNNVMGMYSLKTVNAQMNIVNVKYEALDEEKRSALKEHFDALWSDYDDFYEFEKKRLEALGDMDVYTSEDYGKQKSLSLGQVASAIGDGIMRWANTPQEKTEFSVTIDNKSYKLNSLGEMVDEYGQKNGLRVDTTSKIVYNSRSDAVGYFDGFGYFHNY